MITAAWSSLRTHHQYVHQDIIAPTGSVRRRIRISRSMAAAWAGSKAEGPARHTKASSADASSIDSIVDLVCELLPLADITTGPTTSLGPGAGPHQSLDFVVSALREWPGRGWPLIDAALRSPGVGLRNMAVRALTAWSHDDWTDTLTATVQEALDREPDSDLRARLAALLTEQQRQDDHRQGNTA